MAKKEEDSLMAAVMSGFKAAGIKDAAESVTTMPTKPHSPRSTSVISALLAPAHVVPR